MATIYDVAKDAGVSPKTVSRVLNSDAPVGEKTREAVEASIKKLGYVPSSAARTMCSNRSGLIGLVTGAISHEQRQVLTGLPDMLLVQGAQSKLEAAGKTLLISDTGGHVDRVPKLLRTFAEHRVDGIIYTAAYHQEVVLPEIADTKMVLVNCFDKKGTPSVLPDDFDGQYRLTEKIIAEGHKRIAYLTLPNSHIATKLRTEGYKAALLANNIPYDPALVLEANSLSDNEQILAERLWHAISEVLALPDPPTAICFGNDRLAMRAYGMLRSRGLSLPQDISIAGYDNYQAIASSLFPSLTTEELPYQKMGEQAASLLLSLIDGTSKPPKSPKLIKGKVFWRNSISRYKNYQ